MGQSKYSFDAMRDALSGTDGASCDEFPYDAIDEALAEDANAKTGGRDLLQKDDGAADGEFNDLAMEGFRQTLNLLIGQLIPPGRQCINPRALGIKLLSLLYISNPDAFGGDSMKAVAERCGLSRQSLSQHVLKFNKAYNFSLSWQLSAKRRAILSASSRARWDGRKALEDVAVKLNQELEGAEAGGAEDGPHVEKST